jgi:aminotransferase
MSDGVPVFVDLHEEEGYRFNAEAIERGVSPKTKIMIVNTPNNPTGHVATKGELLQVADIAERHNLIVLSDEILWNWVYDGRRHISFASLPGMKERTVVLSSVTKSGLFDSRIGWVCANAELITQLEKIMFWQNEIAPPICQIAAEAHLRKLKEWITPIVKNVAKGRDIMHEGLRKAGIPCFKPEGNLTMFPDISSFEDSSMKMSKYLLEDAHVLVAPGVRYNGEGHLRLGFHKTYEEITVGTERVQRSIARLAPPDRSQFLKTAR